MKRLIAQVLSVQPLNAEMGLMQLRFAGERGKRRSRGSCTPVCAGRPPRICCAPISIYSVQGDVLHLGIARKGEGTHKLLEAKPGDEVDLLYPLGNGFGKRRTKHIAFVGGGIGVAPLRY